LWRHWRVGGVASASYPGRLLIVLARRWRAWGLVPVWNYLLITGRSPADTGADFGRFARASALAARRGRPKRVILLFRLAARCQERAVTASFSFTLRPFRRQKPVIRSARPPQQHQNDAQVHDSAAGRSLDSPLCWIVATAAVAAAAPRDTKKRGGSATTSTHAR
jgi:hypothetical protein